MTLENLTPEEKSAISELKNIMKNDVAPEVLKDTTLFYRFLKARNFNMNESESMLRNCLQWRKSMQVDTILTDFKPTEVLKKYVSQCFFGYDKEGCPIHYSAIGNIDGKGLFKSVNNLKFLKCIAQEIENQFIRMEYSSKKVGSRVTQCIYIYDMENMTFAKATHKSSIYNFMDLATMIQNNYPELLKRMFVINASIYFTIAFQMVKTIIQGEVINKIKVFGKDGYQEELLKMINSDVLPVFLGGSRTDPDGNPLCNTFMNRAGTVPLSCYLTKDIQKIASQPGVKHVVVDRKSRVSIPVHVNKPKSFLHWEFELKCHDISFGLTLQDPSGDTVVLLPLLKICTEFEPETFKHRCEKEGTYNIVFDNTYSWFHSKEIYYRTWLTNCTD